MTAKTSRKKPPPPVSRCMACGRSLIDGLIDGLCSRCFDLGTIVGLRTALLALEERIQTLEEEARDRK